MEIIREKTNTPTYKAVGDYPSSRDDARKFAPRDNMLLTALVPTGMPSDCDLTQTLIRSAAVGTRQSCCMRVISRPDVHVFLTLQTPSLPALIKTDALKRSRRVAKSRASILT
jgi:hypothetical protein